MLSLLLTAVVAQVADGGSAFPADGGVVAVEEEPTRVTVVTGSRTERKLEDVVVATEVITRTQIEQLGVRDLPQLLQQQPGVEMVYTNRGVGFRLQGLDPAYVLVLVDGERVTGRAGDFTDISRFSLRDIERVEIVKGPAAALYGSDALGGVVNLITRKPTRQLEGAVRGMFGTLLEGDVRGYLGSKLGPVELRAGGGYRTRSPYDWDARDVAQNGPGIARADADAEVAYAPSERLRAWARAAYVRTDLGAIDMNDSGAVFDRRQRTEQFDAWLGTRAALTSDTTLTVRGHFGLFRDQFQVDQRGSRALDDYTRNLTRLWEGFAQVDHRAGRHLVTGGVEGFAELLLSSRTSPEDVRRGWLGAWVQDEWVLSERAFKVAVVPGFRVDLDTNFGAAPSPRLAVKVDPSPRVTVRASWGLGFRVPTFNDLYLLFCNPGIGYCVEGNPKLTSENSGSVNLGVDWRPWDGWTLSASAWHTSLKNLINVSANGVPNPDDPVVFTYENVANAYTQGVEASSRVKISKGTYLEVAYMGLDARDLTRQRPLEGRSNHRFNVQVSSKYRPMGLDGVVRMSWHSQRPFYAGSGLGFANVLGYGEERVLLAPAYVDLEVQLTYTRGFFKVFVNGYNLLNSGDKDFNPRPPRGVIGGLQLEL